MQLACTANQLAPLTELLPVWRLNHTFSVCLLFYLVSSSSFKMMSLRSVFRSGGHCQEALAVISRQPSLLRCLHHQHSSRSTLLGSPLSASTLRHHLHHQHKVLLFSQIRAINIAGEDSLEKARSQNNSRWRQRNDDGDQQRSSKRRSPLAYMFGVGIN